jgi:hypothetical protein
MQREGALSSKVGQMYTTKNLNFILGKLTWLIQQQECELLEDLVSRRR